MPSDGPNSSQMPNEAGRKSIAGLPRRQQGRSNRPANPCTYPRRPNMARPGLTRAARPVAASAQVRQVIGKFDELRIVGRLQYLDHDRLVGAPRAALVLAQGL